MNEIQRNYALAKAHMQALNKEMYEKESQFIHGRNVVNSDGKMPSCLCDIESDEVFEQLCDEFEDHPLNNWKERQEAHRLLEAAEDALIDYAISISPISIRQTLRAGAKIYKHRLKLIDLAMRLDTTTIK